MGLSDSMSVAGKTAVVTGGSNGIGYAICELFVKSGADVALLDLTGAEEAAAKINAATGTNRCSGYDCDVANPDNVDKVFHKIKLAATSSQSKRLDILVNNAGIGHVGDLLATDSAAMDKMYNVNVKGMFHCLHAGVGQMMEDKKGGAVLNLASIASLIGVPDRFAYQMSKGAVLSMTYSVAVDYIKSGVRCNCICPGRVHTPFVDGFLAKNYPGKEAEMFTKLSATQPIGRMGKPTEIAALAMFLCSDEAKFVNGAAVPVDGGQSKLLLSCL